MTSEPVLFYVVLGLIFGAFCSSTAKEKGYSERIWFVIGFFFSIFALIAIAGMPDLITRKYLRLLAEGIRPADK